MLPDAQSWRRAAGSDGSCEKVVVAVERSVEQFYLNPRARQFIGNHGGDDLL
jgi:hypothetical protein